MAHFNRNDLPSEMPDEVKNRYERNAMQVEANLAEITDFIRSLNPEQLHVFSRMLAHMTDTDTGPSTAQRYEGWADATLEFVHGHCHICGRNHAGELLGEDGHPAPPQNKDEPVSIDEFGTVTPPRDDLGVGENPTPDQVHARNLPAGSVIDRNHRYPEGIEPFLSTTNTEFMREFHLDDAWSELGDGTIRFIGFACTGVTGRPCGAIYPTLEDRALRAPDECSMCQQKERWG